MRSNDQQLALWGDEPPEEALPLLQLINRLRTDVWQHADELGDSAPASGIRSALYRQLNAIEDALRPQTMPSAGDWAAPPRPLELSVASQPDALLPDFSDTNWASLESAVISLLPASPEQIAELEQAVLEGSTDPQNRKAAHRLATSLLSRAQWRNLAPWATITAVAGAMLKLADDVTSNQLLMLTIIVMVVLWAMPPPRSGV